MIARVSAEMQALWCESLNLVELILKRGLHDQFRKVANLDWFGEQRRVVHPSVLVHMAVPREQGVGDSPSGVP